MYLEFYKYYVHAMMYKVLRRRPLIIKSQIVEFHAPNRMLIFPKHQIQNPLINVYIKIFDHIWQFYATVLRFYFVKAYSRVQNRQS